VRLITWNCKGAFARKHATIASLKPDVPVLPEAAKMTGLSQVLGQAPVHSVQWVGENPRKGLAVVSYGDYSLAVHERHDPRLRWILPLDVRGPTSFLLFAVWAMPDVGSKRYIQCLFDACSTYGDLLQSPRVVLAGDFNNNVVFDKPGRTMTFARLLDDFEAINIRSLYHLDRGCEHGKEPDPTFFLYHDVNEKHHIDFVFATPSMYRPGFSLSVGDHATWSKVSDHMPVVCSFAVSRKGCDRR